MAYGDDDDDDSGLMFDFALAFVSAQRQMQNNST